MRGPLSWGTIRAGAVVSVYKSAKPGARMLPAYGSELLELCADSSPLDHGGTYYRRDGDAWEVYEIQPVIAYVGAFEASEVGYPWWTRESYLDLDDIAKARLGELDSELACCGSDKDAPTLELVYALHASGYRADEGTGGWRQDMGILRRIATYNEWRAAEAEFRADTKDAGSR
jgi:hypothetical protein